MLLEEHIETTKRDFLDKFGFDTAGMRGRKHRLLNQQTLFLANCQVNLIPNKAFRAIVFSAAGGCNVPVIPFIVGDGVTFEGIDGSINSGRS